MISPHDAHNHDTTGDDSTLARYYPLEGLLPPGHCIAVYPPLCTVTHLSSSPPSKEKETRLPCLLGETRLAPVELCLLLPLLGAYPDYCPTEVFLASYTNGTGTATEQMVERARNHLHTAVAKGEWSQVTARVRNTLSRVRLKIHPLGLTLVSVVTTGYLLEKRESQKKAT